MWPLLKNRRFLGGNSFTQCLVTVVLVFGGIGFYYFNYFQWRHFDKPLEGLTYVKGGTTPQLNSFRKATTSKIIDAAKNQNDRLKEMRKAIYNKKTKQFEKYSDFDQDCKEVRNRLLEIMNEARLRRVPSKFKKKYETTLLGIVEVFDSVNTLKAAFESETQDGIKKGVQESLKLSKKANKRFESARYYFHESKDWAN